MGCPDLESRGRRVCPPFSCGRGLEWPGREAHGSRVDWTGFLARWRLSRPNHRVVPTQARRGYHVRFSCRVLHLVLVGSRHVSERSLFYFGCRTWRSVSRRIALVEPKSTNTFSLISAPSVRARFQISFQGSKVESRAKTGTSKPADRAGIFVSWNVLVRAHEKRVVRVHGVADLRGLTFATDLVKAS